MKTSIISRFASFFIAAFSLAISWHAVAAGTYIQNNGYYIESDYVDSGNGPYLVDPNYTRLDDIAKCEFTATPPTGTVLYYWQATYGSYGDVSFGTNVNPVTVSMNDKWISGSLSHTFYLTPHFRYINYAVRYDKSASDATGSMADLAMVYNTSATLAKSSFSRSGYAFGGWDTSADATKVVYADGASVSNLTTVEGDTVTLYAVWKPNTVKVYFDTNDGDAGATVSPQKKNVTYGEAYTDLPTPVWTGHEFLGWYDSDAGGNVVTNGTIVSVAETHNLYAHWQTITYTIKINNHGASSGATSVDVTWGEELPALNVPAWNDSGIVFGGYWSEPDGQGTCYWDENGQPIQSAWKWTDASFEPPSTLHAWPKGYTFYLQYDANGGIGDMPKETHKIEIGKKLTLSDGSNFSNARQYRLLGWGNDKSATTISYELGESVDPRDLPGVGNGKTVSLYAIWRDMTMTNVLNACGGTVNGEAVTNIAVIEGFVYGKLPAAVRDNFDFEGWFTAVDGGDQVTDETIVVASITNLYAHWSGKSFMLDFNGNGADAGATPSQKFRYNEAIAALNANGFSRTGYSFAGWATNAADAAKGTVTYADCEENVHNPPTPLYAVWTPIAYRVTFDRNCEKRLVLGDDPSALENREYGKSFKLPAQQYDPVGGARTFLGWSADAKATTADFANQAVVSNLTAEAGATVTLYAVWNAQLSNLSKAVGCDNLILETDDDDKVWTVCEGGNGVQSGLADNYSEMSANILCPGKLKFTWYMESGAKTKDFWFDASGVGEYSAKYFTPTASSTTVEVNVKHEGTVTWKSESSYYRLFVTSVKFVPEGVAEEESEDEIWAKGYFTEEQIAAAGGWDNLKTQLSGKKSFDGTALTYWDDYVAGTDPTNLSSRLLMGIGITNGVAYVWWQPNLGAARTYTVSGKVTLNDANWISPTNSTHQFFKLDVALP